MILMSYRVKNGNTPPIYVRGGKGSRKIVGQVRSSIRAEPFPIAEEVLKNMQTFRNRDLFVYVAPGARILPPLALLEGQYDVAAHVQLVGERPVAARAFSGVGQVRLETLAFRRSEATRRVLERWRDRLAARGGSPSVALAIALREVGEARLLHLPAEYCWIESLHRPVNRAGVPVIEHLSAPTSRPLTVNPPDEKEQVKESKYAPKQPEVVLVSHFSQFTGFGGFARQILFRISNNLKVKIDGSLKEPSYIDRDLQARVDAYKGAICGPRAPILRMMGPCLTSSPQRKKLLWTMMESSERVHPDMVRQINEYWDEIIVPTSWGLGVFRDSGVRLPGRVIPLGVNPMIYRPLGKKKLPKCRLISTERRGLLASPDGFIFLTVGLPGRKGWDVIADAFELAFLKKRGVHFVIGLTHSPAAWNQKIYKQFSKYKVPIWTLEGSFSDHEMAQMYSSCDCYVSASSGEGFGLPPAEAAAVGLPVILPNNTAHTEVFGPQAFLFDGDGVRTRPDWDPISDWYKGMLFAYFGKKSITRLADLMRFVKKGGVEVRSRADALRKKIVEQYTWDRSAEEITKRILEAQP